MQNPAQGMNFNNVYNQAKKLVGIKANDNDDQVNGLEKKKKNLYFI